MRLLGWTLTVAFGLAGIALREQPWFALAPLVGQGCLVLAVLACPFLWAKGGFMPEELAPSGRSRLMLGLALVLAAPILLPWR